MGRTPYLSRIYYKRFPEETLKFSLTALSVLNRNEFVNDYVRNMLLERKLLLMIYGWSTNNIFFCVKKY